MRRVSALFAAILIGGAVLIAQAPITPSAPVVGTVYTGNTPVAPRRLKIDWSYADSELIPGVSGSRVCVLAMRITMTGTAVTIRFEDTTGGAFLSGEFLPLIGHTLVWPFNPACWFLTSSGNSLGMHQTGTSSIDGEVVYALIEQ